MVKDRSLGCSIVVEDDLTKVPQNWDSLYYPDIAPELGKFLCGVQKHFMSNPNIVNLGWG